MLWNNNQDIACSYQILSRIETMLSFRARIVCVVALISQLTMVYRGCQHSGYCTAAPELWSSLSTAPSGFTQVTASTDKKKPLSYLIESIQLIGSKSAQRKAPRPPSRPRYRTVQGGDCAVRLWLPVARRSDTRSVLSIRIILRSATQVTVQEPVAALICICYCGPTLSRSCR